MCKYTPACARHIDTCILYQPFFHVAILLSISLLARLEVKPEAGERGTGPESIIFYSHTLIFNWRNHIRVKSVRNIR